MTAHDMVRMDDGVQLARTRYDAPQPRALLCVLHGLGEHMGRYGATAQALGAQGISLCGLDHRGHGHSEGGRGGDDFATMRSDALASLGAAAQEGLPLFLLGHSMGGGLALNLLLTADLPIKGAVVLSPWLQLVNPPTGPTLAALQVGGRVTPHLRVDNGLSLQGLSHDEASNQAYDQDPLVHSRIAMGVALGALNAGKSSIENAASLHTPLLLIHGESDPICSANGSRAFAKNAGAMCDYHEYPGMYHELMHEPDVKEDLFARIAQFVQSKL